MKRFRRNSDKKRKESEAQAAPPPPPALPSLPKRTQLEAQDFRTSLILPHLTRRFTLLRSEDGRLVSLDTMQEHLAAQKETGNLTAFEADAVLAQYRFQTQYEDPSLPVDKAAAWMERNQLSKARGGSFEEGEESTRTSLFSSSTSDHDAPRSASSFGAASSVNPFSYASFDTAPVTPVEEPRTIANFRRGGNSLFGGRVMSSSQMKMSKSMSSVSIASMGSAAARRKASESFVADLPAKEAGTPEEGGGQLGMDHGVTIVTEDSEEAAVTPESERSALISDEGSDPPFVDALDDELTIPQLSPRQLHRISHVLDDIEVELSRTYMRMTGYESDEEHDLRLLSSPEGTPDPAGDDDDMVDPFFKSTPLLNSSVSPPLLPSSPFFDSSLETSPIVNLSHPLPTPIIAPAPSVDERLPVVDHSEETPAATTSTLPLLRSPPTALAFSLPVPPTRQSISESPSTKHESYTSSDHGVPAAYTFPAVPSRNGSSVSDHASSPSTRNSVVTRSGSKGSDSRSRPYAATSASTGPSATFSSHRSSVGSAGSSYHGEAAASVEDLTLPAQRSSTFVEGEETPDASEVLKEKNDEEEEEDHLRAVSAVSRRPSTELLHDLGPSVGLGNTNLVLEDLVVIQDSLVRSASKRAERNAEGSSPVPTTVEALLPFDSGVVPVVVDEEQELLASDVDSSAQADPRESSMEMSERDSFESSVAETSVASGANVSDLSSVTNERTFSSLDTVQDLPLASNVAGLGIDTTPPRVPRTMAPRGPTPSVLLRDVRTQADLATNALKPAAGKVIRRSKSVRSFAISQPQFVSGPTGIPAVPIINPAIRVREPDVVVKDVRTKSSKPSIGLRFKMLMKKQSRDQLPPLTGEEVTPFETIDFETSVSPAATPPFTPPSQSSAEFASSSPDYPRTPTNEFPHTPERRMRTPSSTLSTAVDEGSPTTPKDNGSIKRAMSRLRRRKQSDDAGLVAGDEGSTSRSVTPSPSTTSSLPRRKQSVEGETVGLGFSLNSRAPTSYDIGSIRRRREQTEMAEMPRTAPLDVRREHPSPLDLGMAHTAAPATQSDPLPASRGPAHGRPGSTASMRDLRETAQDLGLPADEAQELVNLSYGVASPPLAVPTTPPSSTKHRRGQGSVSSTGSGSRARSHRSPGSRSIHERSPTPPPGAAHRKKASIDRLAHAGPVPQLPEGARPIPGSRSGELSTASNLVPPSSPGGISVDSFRSSGYAGSVFGDYYADETEEHREYRKSMMFAGLPEFDARDPMPMPTSAGTEGDGLLWTVIDGLRKERPMSTISDTFHSRHSSFDSNRPVSPGTRVPEPFNFQMRHHRRNRSSQSSQVPSARGPSVYVRDEQRLEALAFEGGIAQESEGNFIVRPRHKWSDTVRTEEQEEDDIVVK